MVITYNNFIVITNNNPMFVTQLTTTTFQIDICKTTRIITVDVKRMASTSSCLGEAGKQQSRPLRSDQHQAMFAGEAQTTNVVSIFLRKYFFTLK